MLLTITTTHKPATDLGYLLHKNPARCQTVDLTFGSVHIFYPEAGEDRCTMAMLLDIDPVEMIRGRRAVKGSPLEHYINDRPYAASSFTSVAIARALGSALRGQCREKPELVNVTMPLTVKISVLPCQGGEDLLRRLFEPLGYQMKIQGYSLNEQFPEWGPSPYYSVELTQSETVAALLSHLYVLIPVLDNQKHYFIDKNEVDKLLKRSEDWLPRHPEKELITKRYLKYRKSLAAEALSRLTDEHQPDTDVTPPEMNLEQNVEKHLNETRMEAVLAVLKASQAKSVIDMGCGEGKLLSLLLKDPQFEKILGMDVSIRSLEIASRRLHLEDLAPRKREQIDLIHGSLMYRDSRFQGFDAAVVVEVIEHMDPPRLTAFERVLFKFAKPETIIITTPNQEYNTTWESLAQGHMRHSDHRFEWTRQEFQDWANQLADQYDYHVDFAAIGEVQEHIGSPTQMAIFKKTNT